MRLQFTQGVGASVSYLVRLAKRNSSSQYIHTCSKSLLNTGSPNPFLIHVKHCYNYRKHHLEGEGDPCPVPTSNTKSTPDRDYFMLLPHKVTKMTIWVSNGSHCLCKIPSVLHTMPLVPPSSQHSKVCLAFALETQVSQNMPFCLARQALCRGIARRLVPRRKNIITFITSLGRRHEITRPTAEHRLKNIH